MNTFGENIKLTIFGESHGEAIGMVLDGFPPGENIDIEDV
ncbi:MAG: chorismate synthase, partial [Clostridiales bacterium]|nr:chorismate synthase [Clostridiales bacterium]